MVRWPMLNNQNGSPEIGLEIGNEAVIGDNGYLPVKVTMDGISLGRKVDLRAHDSYETMTQTLDDKLRDIGLNAERVGSSYLLSGKDEYVPTYKDHEGDLMFAGDVCFLTFCTCSIDVEMGGLLKFREEDSNNENF
ncbi:auxin-responsive protein IAA13 isoform X2 [Tanacetum coccineum]